LELVAKQLTVTRHLFLSLECILLDNWSLVGFLLLHAHESLGVFASELLVERMVVAATE